LGSNIYHPSLFSISKMQDRGTNSETVLNKNRRLILRLIKDDANISRKSIVEKTGLKGATITVIMNEFLEDGIIKKVGLMEGDSGRRVMGFRLADEQYCTVAIRINISYVKFCVYDINNVNLFVKKIFMDSLTNLEHTCDVIASQMQEAKSIIGDRIVMGIGVGVEGPFIIEDGYYKIRNAQHPEEYFDIGKVLAEKLGYPVIINKANNFAVYHVWTKEYKPEKLGIYVNVNLSYTIECGIIVNGEILNGSSGTVGLLGNIPIAYSNDGEVITLNEKCSTNTTLNQVINSLKDYPDSVLQGKSEDLNIRDVIKAFVEEDPLAVKIFTEVGTYMGKAVASLTNLLNPDMICVGDEIPYDARMLEIMENEAKKYCPKDVNLNLQLTLDDYLKARDTKKDPCLLGASTYVVDAFLQSMEFKND